MLFSWFNREEKSKIFCKIFCKTYFKFIKNFTQFSFFFTRQNLLITCHIYKNYVFILLPFTKGYIFLIREFAFINSLIRDCLIGAVISHYRDFSLKISLPDKNINLLLEMSETSNCIVNLRNGALCYLNFCIHIPWNLLDFFNRLQYRDALVEYHLPLPCSISRGDRLINIIDQG